MGRLCFASGYRHDSADFPIEDILIPTGFRPYQPEQMLLLPPDLRDWVPEGHLAHHVSDLVGSLDLNAYYAPYEPSMMVKVLIYGYAAVGENLLDTCRQQG